MVLQFSPYKPPVLVAGALMLMVLRRAASAASLCGSRQPPHQMKSHVRGGEQQMDQSESSVVCKSEAVFG